MKQNTEENVTQKIKAQSNSAAVRVTKKGQKKLSDLLNKANKKSFGKKIKGYQIVELGLSLITDSHIRELQDSSLSNSDLIDIKFRDYVKKNGKISKDEFLGVLLKKSQSEVA